MSSTRPPPLLAAHLGLPPAAALVVVTSVLGARANWLVLRWTQALLQRGDAAVVLVSFLRDGAFWRDGAAKLGLDLAAARRFRFVDALTGLFAPTADAHAHAHAAVLARAGLSGVRAAIDAALVAAATQSDTRRTVLVIDHIDVLVAAAADDGSARSLAVQAMLLSLRERVHATILTLAADDALLHAQTTRLEREHAALVLSLAHAARTVVALRALDTGAARDVSGVVRISPRSAGYDDDDDDDPDDPDDPDGPGPGPGSGPAHGRRAAADAEYLYHVAGDGSVRVFERGA